MAKRGRRGFGTVYFSKRDKRFIARYPLGVVDGKRREKRVKCLDRDEADDELDKLRRLYAHGGHRFSGTLDEYLRDWLPSHGRRIRPSTLVSYRGHIDHHIGPLLGGIRLADLAPRDVRRLITACERKGLSAGTIHLVIRTLSAALGRAKAERIIVDNPVEGVELPRIVREPVRALTLAEADRIIDATTGTWLGPLVRVLLGSGLRLGEALGLDQRDLLLDAGFVRIRRSKTTVRAVPVSDDAVAALRDALAAAPRIGPEEPVFFGPRKSRHGHRDRMRGYSVSHALPKLLEGAGLGHLAPHALRHGVATLMLAEGTPIRVIAEQLGHRDRGQLAMRVYAHVVPDAQRSAVASLPRRRSG